ncbi:hypothetical protein Tc00.1047053506131.60 [Trypanosoma cruzi]|uniref:Uncharacterized protein n=1 Tax=Trypanosoma cruzi (strain CL Brener) TaxID=353153 RepID=Q4DLD4_TRYCC|nr:hypothetical protein Tc00.1047053506131.60 [Trypanosoma cruzi]EAN93334.1 hypothetical protein Tc00.1047053506131.60 [Trypanosoma cruzi]|eukprot:XP_815185.1 hypothetical protein [Trypanosoma cruzi strain CL Brener]
MEDAPPPIHGSNTAAAACPFPLLLLLAAAAAVPTLSNGYKREAYINWHVPVSIYIHSACPYTLYQGHAVCTLPLLCWLLMCRHHACIMGWDKKLFDFFWSIQWGVCVRVRGICVVLISLFLFSCFGIV